MTIAIQQSLWQAEIHALSDQRQGQSGDQVPVQTIPDTSLPWSKEAGPDGYSAKMFLHQTIKTFASGWSFSDTERLLSEQTPTRLQARIEPATSLSDVIKPPKQTSSDFILSDKAVRGLIRRNIIRRRAILVLLRTHADMTRVMVTFGIVGQPLPRVKVGQLLKMDIFVKLDGVDYELLIQTKEQHLQGSLLDGLTDYLKQRLRELQGTQSCRRLLRK
jgi:hypothetical protein